MPLILLTWLGRLTITVFSLTLGFTFCGLFLVPNGKTILSNLLVISILFGIINLILGGRRKTGIIDRRLLWVFLGYAIFILFNRFVHGDQYGVMRSLGYVVLFGLLLPREKIIVDVSRYAALCGGLGLGGISIWQQSIGIERVEGFTNAILFSQAALSIALLNWFFYLEFKEQTITRLLSTLAMCSSLFALYASQSRGVWLALLAVLGLIFISKAIEKPSKYILVGMFSLASMAIFFQHSTVLQQRVEQAMYDVNSAEQGQFETSWGLRIIAWQSAWLGFIDHPILGVGTDGFDVLKQNQASSGMVSKLILHPSLAHAHNQYMQNLVLRGGIGFIFIIMFLVYPFSIAVRKYGITSVSALLPIAFFISGMSDVPFEHQSIIYIYTLELLFIVFFYEMKDKDVAA